MEFASVGISFCLGRFRAKNADNSAGKHGVMNGRIDIMQMKPWDALPEALRTEEVRLYYDLLKKRTASLLLKRGMDILASLLLLLLLFPVFLVLAIAIKADSKGPVFFRQVRVTQFGRTFRIFKFRTMVSDAEKKGSQVTVQNDCRVTRVGAKIRHVRLDEIPQLLNVLTGDMSFVGTRPEVPRYVERYTPEMMATLLLPAGVTSTASIEFKDEDKLLQAAENADEVYVQEVLPQKMAYNLAYLRRFSFGRDIGILFQTVFRVFGSGRGKVDKGSNREIGS